MQNFYWLFRENGISAIPVNKDKTPALSGWKEYQRRLPSREECNRWANIKGIPNLAVVCGRVTQGLEIIDIDNKGGVANSIYNEICERLKQEAPDLFSRLVIERSKNNGYHIGYRCEQIAGNQKLARKQIDGKLETVIETRGEGGYCIVAPSQGYEKIQKDFLQVETITPEERGYLLDLCRGYDEENKAKKEVKEPIKETISGTPTPKMQATINPKILAKNERVGDLYNEGDYFKDVLFKHGWTVYREEPDKIHFKRPGKPEDGNSADFLLESRLFYVFSTNALPFEAYQTYTPFAIYALLECGGDYSEAVKRIVKEYPELNVNHTPAPIIQKHEAKKKEKEKEKKGGSGIFEFWVYKPTSKNKIEIDAPQLGNFLEANNIYYYYKEGKPPVLVHEWKSNVLKIINEEYILKYIQDYINNLPNEYCFNGDETLRKEAIKAAFDVFDDRKMNLVIKRLKMDAVELNKPTDGVIYMYFQNCVVGYKRGNNRKVDIIDYKDLKWKVWDSKVIKRDFKMNKAYKGGDVDDFLKSVCTSKTGDGGKILDKERERALINAVGYLMNDYKHEDDVKIIVLCEEQITDMGGRTGKSLTCKMLENMGCNVVWIDGRSVDFKNRFLFQNITEETDIVVFDDIDRKFDFKALYSIATTGLTVEKKGKNAVHLSHKETPKFIITTNTVLTDESNSGKSRKFEIEFSDHFNDEYTPILKYGRRFFDGWNEEDWSLFDNYMIDCAISYIEEGLTDYKRVNITERKLTIAIPDANILNHCDRACIYMLETKGRMTNEEIFKRFKSEYDPNEYTQRQLMVYLKRFIEIKNLKALQYKNFKENGKQERGYVFIEEHANHKDVIKFLEEHNLPVDEWLNKNKEEEEKKPEEGGTPNDGSLEIPF